jgi:hypothetical protein
MSKEIFRAVEEKVAILLPRRIVVNLNVAVVLLPV